MSRGYFEIGVLAPKTSENVGTLWRSAYQLGAAGIFVIGPRFHDQASNTIRAQRHLPTRSYPTLADFLACRPFDCPLIGVEQGGECIYDFQHPERAVYLLGAEDHGLSRTALAACNAVVSLPSLRSNSFNVAVAGSLVMYERMRQRRRQESLARLREVA